jgi:hypothetical protein
MSQFESPPDLVALIRDMQRRLAALERNASTLQVINGTPADSPNDGAQRVDKAANKLWVRVNGAYHYTALT